MKDSVLKTLAYFDYHNHPLSFAEICRFLIAAEDVADPRDEEVLKTLENLTAEGKIGEENGFYFLAGRKDIVSRRHENYIYYLNRIFRAAKLIKILKYVPYIRSIILSGSTAAMYGDVKGDIDFFVITKPNRIWLARLFLSGVTQILGVRRHGDKITDRICLNHYLVEGVSPEIKYRPLDYASMLCLLNPGPARAMLAGLAWLKGYLAKDPGILSDSVLTQKGSKIIQPLLEGILEILGAHFWNKMAARYQQNRIKMSPGILIKDTELAFHPSDKWQAMMAQFNSRVGS